ncbi:MAG: diguanylate cyclase [Pseudomonadales bacterium]|nr:diguanylate cyclase [Pseudomonadales bacterium]
MQEIKLGGTDTPLAASREGSTISPKVLSEIFDSFEDAVIVADTKRHMIYVNSAAERLFGYSKEELHGEETKLLYADEDDFSEIGRKGINVANDPAAMNYRVLCKRSGGEQFLAMTTSTTMRTADGNVVGFIGIVSPARSADQSLDALQKIHNITSDITMSYDEKIASLLRVGLNHFGLETAILSNITGDDYVVESCVDLRGELEPSTKFEVSGTYCVHTLKKNATVGFHYAGKSEIQHHPCYQNLRLESYIGTPIRLDGKLYGTVNFTSPSPVEPFCKDDYILMELLSDTFSYLLYKKISEEELEALARIDALTGLPNRRATLERLTQLIDQSSRFTENLSVVSIDIDHFKKINDTFGHAAGDQALVEFARVASSLGRKTDFCGRIGGEEFIFVLPGANLESAQKFGDKLRHSLAAEAVELSNGESITIKISAGVAMLHNDEYLESLLARADDAMYRAKQQGRDRVCQ